MYTLEKTTIIHGAHKLEDSDSLVTKECQKDYHGHDYKVTVKIDTVELLNGMVIDFGRLNQILFFGDTDHVNYNKYLDNPTAENIAKYYWIKISDELKEMYSSDYVLEVKVEESENNSVTYTL